MRYSGAFGFSETKEVSPGVWEDVITEKQYIGDVVQTTEKFVGGSDILPKYSTTTSISVVSDGVLKTLYEDLRYVTYLGIRWAPSSIVVQWPRLVVYIGEEYHGPGPQPPEEPSLPSTPDPDGD